MWSEDGKESLRVTRAALATEVKTNVEVDPPKSGKEHSQITWTRETSMCNKHTFESYGEM